MAADRVQDRGIAWRLTQPIDVAALAFARVAIAGLVIWELVRFFQYGWVETHLIAPGFHFNYLGFGWVRPLPGNGVYWVFAASLAAWLCVALGAFYRVTSVIGFLGVSYVFLLEQSIYLNHLYLVCLFSFLLVFLPAHRAFSVDAWRRPERRSDYVPAWTLFLLRSQMGLVYFYAGIAKLNPDWLAGYPLRLWLPSRTDFPVIGALFAQPWVGVAFSWAGLGLDLFAWPALIWRRTRPFAFVALLVFHLMNSTLFDIGIFPWLSIAATSLFFPPDWPRRALARFRNVTASEPVGFAYDTRARVALCFVALYMAVQLLVPLRHWIYPGNVAWTEEGHAFSWRQKLRSKQGAITWHVTDRVSGQTFEIDDRAFLEQRQRQKMPTRPDMILQYAHFLADRYREQMGRDVEIRATVTASLNGREPQLLIDPNTDLARQPRNLWPRKWITPLEASRN